jgi:hypothetical protein
MLVRTNVDGKREGTIAPMQRAEHEALKQKGTICPYVFHRNGRRIKSLRKSWALACEAAGYPGMRSRAKPICVRASNGSTILRRPSVE